MAEDSFLLVSLDEDKSKKLAQVLSNDTSRKILDLLSKKDLMTETDISAELKIPLSTTHYNLGLLVSAGLLNSDNFKYSEKGKKVVHYTLSNKYVIIAPKNSNFLKDKLREFLPVIFIVSLTSLFLNYFWKPYAEPQLLMADSFAAGAAMKAAAPVAAVPEISRALSSSQEVALWFLIGSLFALLLSFLWTTFILKQKKY